MDRDEASLLDIANAAKRITRFVEGVTREAFEHNEEKQSAVVYQIAVIGEATKRLSQNVRRQHADIPWSQMAGMRDRLMHGYDRINVDRVWEVTIQEIPILLAGIEPLLPVEPTESTDTAR